MSDTFHVVIQENDLVCVSCRNLNILKKSRENPYVVFPKGMGSNSITFLKLRVGQYEVYCSPQHVSNEKQNLAFVLRYLIHSTRCGKRLDAQQNIASYLFSYLVLSISQPWSSC